MTPELREFRKWGIVASLIQRASEDGCCSLNPVVLSEQGLVAGDSQIALLIIHENKAFFFSSYPEGSIAVETWNADSDDILESDWLFSSPMRDDLTFDQIAQAAIAKIFQ